MGQHLWCSTCKPLMTAIRKSGAIEGFGVNKLGKKEFAQANHYHTTAN